MPRRTIDKKIPRFNRGAKALSTSHMNALVDGVNRALVGVDAPTPVRRVAGSGTAIVKLTLVAHNGDYLECTDAGGNTVLVAKPYELRQTTFDGLTVGGIAYSYTSASQRTATNAAISPGVETQYITPSYITGAEIYASKISGGTGVNDDSSPQVGINYLEINQGRAWAWDDGS